MTKVWFVYPWNETFETMIKANRWPIKRTNSTAMKNETETQQYHWILEEEAESWLENIWHTGWHNWDTKPEGR